MSHRRAFWYGDREAAERRAPQKMNIGPARKKLTDLLGSSKVIADRDALEPYSRDASHSGAFMPDLVVRADSVRDVQEVLAVATEHHVPVTPRGLGSGKSG